MIALPRSARVPVAAALLSASAGSLWLVLAAASPGLAAAASAPDPAAPIRVLRDASGIAIEALVEIRTVDPTYATTMSSDGERIDASFSYASDGTAWRVRFEADPTRFPNGREDVSFVPDGAIAPAAPGLTRGRTAVLDAPVVAQSVEPTVLAVLPNPLFELAGWVRPRSTATLSHYRHLSELHDYAESELAIAPEEWSPLVEGEDTWLVAHLPGGEIRGESYTIRLVVAVDAPDRLRRIDRLRADGSMSWQTLFDGWAPPDGWSEGPLFPRLVRNRDYTQQPDGQTLMTSEVSLTIVEFRLAPPLDPDDVEIDLSAEPVLWHANLQEFIEQ